MSARQGKRRRWLWVYLVLLAVSFVVQLFWPGAPSPRAGNLTADVQRQKSDRPVDGDPVRITYTDTGDGPALILIHGSPGSKENFARLAPMLAPHFRFRACVHRL